MRVTIALFNCTISLFKKDVFTAIVMDSNQSEKMKKQMILYHTMITNNIDKANMLFTKDKNLIVGLLEFIGEMYDAENLNSVLIESMEQSEQEDTEGQYLNFCNKTLKMKKFFEVLANNPYIINPNSIIIDDVYIWFYIPN